MRIGAKCAAAILALVGAVPAYGPAEAKPRAQAPPPQIGILYAPPKNPAHQEIHEQLKRRRMLEQFREALAPIRLPKPLRLRLDECNGVANAWYEDAVVTVCYEYVAELRQHAPAATTADGLTREAAVLGPVIEVFLHEIGHAVFDVLKVPVFGREEDAADQFAAYILLHFGKQEAREVIRGVAAMYMREALAQSPGFQQFADAHGLPAQRLFNLLCLAYGANPNDPELAGLVRKGFLPSSRAEGCAGEYRQVDYAFRRLLHPHMNVARARQLLRRKWLR